MGWRHEYALLMQLAERHMWGMSEAYWQFRLSRSTQEALSTESVAEGQVQSRMLSVAACPSEDQLGASVVQLKKID